MSKKKRPKKAEKPKYSLWTMPRSAWESPLQGVKLDPNVKIDEKQLEEAIRRNEERFACFKPRRLSGAEWVELMFRPLP